MLVVRQSARGRQRWARQLGGQRRDAAHDLAVGLDGRAYVLGRVGRLVYAGTTRASGSSDDAPFVWALDADGRALWHAWPAPHSDHHRDLGRLSLATVGDGVYVAGTVRDAAHRKRGFMTVLDVQGRTGPSYTIGSDDGATEAYALAFSTSGEVVVGGRFYRTLRLGEHTLRSRRRFTPLDWSARSVDAFVAHLQPPASPSRVPASRTTRPRPEVPAALLSPTHRSEDAWGYLSSPYRPTITQVVGAPDGEFFVAGHLGPLGEMERREASLSRLRPDGTVRWSRPLPGVDSDQVSRLVPDGAGGLYAIGIITGRVLVGDAFVQPHGARGAFAARLTADGEIAWFRAYRGPGTATAYGAALAPDGGLYVAGAFIDHVVLGPDTLRSLDEEEGLVMRLTPEGNVRWAARAGGIESSSIARHAVGFLGLAAVPGGVVAVGGARGTVALGPRSTVPAERLRDTRGGGIAVRWSEEGVATWVHRLRVDQGRGSSTAAVPAPDGGVFVAGHLEGTATVAGTRIGTPLHEIQSPDDRIVGDGYLLHLGPDGKARWARTVRSEHALVPALAPDGTLFVLGAAASESPAFAGQPVAPGLFLASLAPTGAVGHLAPWGSFRRAPAHCVGLVMRALHVGQDGRAVATGWLAGTASVGPLRLETNGSQGFIVSLPTLRPSE